METGDRNLELLYPAWAKGASDSKSSSVVRLKNTSSIPDPPGFSSQKQIGGKQVGRPDPF